MVEDSIDLVSAASNPNLQMVLVAENDDLSMVCAYFAPDPLYIK
jgi:hypothetical protein